MPGDAARSAVGCSGEETTGQDNRTHKTQSGVNIERDVANLDW
jgi:hypothetical protein